MGCKMEQVNFAFDYEETMLLVNSTDDLAKVLCETINSRQPVVWVWSHFRTNINSQGVLEIKSTSPYREKQVGSLHSLAYQVMETQEGVRCCKVVSKSNILKFDKES